MKGNPAYEEAVLKMLGETYAQEVSSYLPKVSYQVIGASMEECYGSEIPVKNYGLMMGLTGLAGTGSSLTGLAGLNAYSFGLTGLGSSLTGLAGLNAYGSGLTGLSSPLAGLAGTNYQNMVNAYQKTAANKSGDTSIREYKSRWREKT